MQARRMAEDDRARLQLALGAHTPGRSEIGATVDAAHATDCDRIIADHRGPGFTASGDVVDPPDQAIGVAQVTRDTGEDLLAITGTQCRRYLQGKLASQWNNVSAGIHPVTIAIITTIATTCGKRKVGSVGVGVVLTDGAPRLVLNLAPGPHVAWSGLDRHREGAGQTVGLVR